MVREYATRCKTVVQRLVDEVKNRNNPATAEELFSPDYVHHFNFPGVELPPGLAGSATIGGIFGTAFPEIKVTLEILIADGEFVLERSSVVALHAGEFLGTLATNQTVTWTENHLYRIVDGRIVEHWPEVDIAGLLETDGSISCPLSGSLWTFGRMLKAAQVMGGSLTSCRWSGREDLNLRSPRPERERTGSVSPFSRIAVPHGAHISAAHRIIGSEEGRRIRSIRRLRVPGPNPGSSGGRRFPVPILVCHHRAQIEFISSPSGSSNAALSSTSLKGSSYAFDERNDHSAVRFCMHCLASVFMTPLLSAAGASLSVVPAARPRDRRSRLQVPEVLMAVDDHIHPSPSK